MNDLKLFGVLVILLRIIISSTAMYIGGSDYDADEVITRTFMRRHRSVTIPIFIVTGGDVVERHKYFTVELQLPTKTKQKGVYPESPTTARIEIIDGMKFLHSHTCMYNYKDYIVAIMWFSCMKYLCELQWHST